MRNKLVIAIALLSILVLSACTTSPTGQVTRNDDTIKFGAPLALTGYANTWGEAELRAAILAVGEINAAGGINGKQIELVVEDFASDGKQALSSTLKLVDQDEVDVLIGTTWLDSYLSAAAVSNDRDILMVTPSALITAINDAGEYNNVFSLYYRGDKKMSSLPEYFAGLGVEKIAIIHTQDIYWSDLSNYIVDNAAAQGIEVVEYVEVNPGTTDYKTIISKLQAADPDIIFAGFVGEADQVAFLKQRAELYPESTLFSTDYIGAFVGQEDHEGLLEDVDFVAPSILESDFSDKYEDAYGIEPVFSASNMYDTVNILAEAIEATESTDANTLREYLLATEFDTVTFGRTGFDNARGISKGDFVVRSIEGNEIRTIATLG